MSARCLVLACLSTAVAAQGVAVGASAQDAAGTQASALENRVESLQSREAEETRLRQEWQTRERDGRREVAKARAHLAEISANRIRARDGAYQGIKRSEWTRRWKEAQAELEGAERALEDLHEEARREDIPPGWLDDAAEAEAGLED